MKPCGTHYSQMMLNPANMINIQSSGLWHWAVQYTSTIILEDPPVSIYCNFESHPYQNLKSFHINSSSPTLHTFAVTNGIQLFYQL